MFETMADKEIEVELATVTANVTDIVSVYNNIWEGVGGDIGPYPQIKYCSVLRFCIDYDLSL